MHVNTSPTDDTKAARLLQSRAGKRPGPWQMVVFPTNRCNLKCSICWQRYAEETFGKLEHAREIPDERWLALVDEAAALQVREWSIAGGGEPFVRANLVMAMCERIRAKGMNGGVYTNGTLLKSEHIEHLVKLGWERLDFSMDGPTAETNDAVRGPGAFVKALAALHMLQEIKQANDAVHPIVDVHCVLTRHNVEKMEEMAHLVHRVGVKSLGFSMLQVQSKECAAFELTEAQLKALPALGERTAVLCDRLQIKNNAGTLSAAITRTEERAAGCAFSADTFLGAGCYEPFLSVAVLAEGQAGPCCAFWDPHADNIRDLSLETIWNGAWFAAMRKRLMQRDYPDFCEHCPSHFVWQTEEYRKELRAHLFTGPRPLSFSLLKDALVAFKKRGLTSTLRRGYEWLRINLFRN